MCNGVDARGRSSGRVSGSSILSGRRQRIRDTLDYMARGLKGGVQRVEDEELLVKHGRVVLDPRPRSTLSRRIDGDGGCISCMKRCMPTSMGVQSTISTVCILCWQIKTRRKL